MNASRRTARAAILAVGGSFLITGCGPSRVLDAPGHWPSSWRGLELYHTPEAFIYARGAAAAGEADRVLHKVGKDFRRSGGGTSKGLVIISNSPDELPVSNPEAWYRLAARGAPAHRHVSDEQLAAQWQAIQTSMGDQAINPATELQVRSLALIPQVLPTNLGFPSEVTDDIAWVVAMPTHRLIQSGCKQLMEDKIAARGIGRLAVIATAGVLIVEEQRMVNNATVHRDLQVFEALGAADPDWADGPGTAETQVYAQRKIDEAMLPVLSTLRDVMLEVGYTVGEVVVDPVTKTLGGEESPDQP